MGYELHITRNPDWVEDGPIITLEEWQALVEKDPELQMDNTGEGDAIWTAYSRHGQKKYGTVVFFYFDGEITFKHPDVEIIGKMWRIAQALGARVQGDEGEEYGEDGEPIGDDAKGFRFEDDDVVEPSSAQRSKPWWKFW